MGALVSCMATQAACCFGNAALNCFCRICGSTVSTASRVGYSLLFLWTACLSYVMLTDWASKRLSEITYGYFHLNCPQGDCFGIIAVYRICFATSLFHIIMSLLTYSVESTKDWRASLQNGFWGFKLLAWFAFATTSFFIPNSFFMGWTTYINMPGASLFILIQVILLIDVSYSISETLLSWWEMYDDKRYLLILIFLTFSGLVGSIVIVGLLYAYFSACQLNQFFISFHWILCLITCLLSIHPTIQEENPKSGLAQSAMITVYCTYLVASSIVSEPLQECNPWHQKRMQSSNIIIGSLFTFLALAYSTTRAASDPFTADDVPMASSERHLYEAVEQGAISSTPEDDEADGVQYNYSFFHTVFALGSMYLAMLITNWNSLIETDDKYVVGGSMASVWVKIVSSWLILIIYGWTIIAPYCLPDRDWN